MSVFRTRKIKTKYAKLRKKQDLLRHNKAVAFSRKNWVISNTIADVLPLSQTTNYKTVLNNKITHGFQYLTCNHNYNSMYANNSFPFYDSTVKLFSVFERGLHFFVENSSLIFFETLAQRFYPDGLIFYCASVSLFFGKIKTIFCNFVSQFNFVFFSSRKFAYANQLLPKDGLYILIYPNKYDNEDNSGNAYCQSTKLLFFLLFEMFKEDNKSFFVFDYNCFFVFLGFFFNNYFYNFSSLILKFKSLSFFFQGVELEVDDFLLKSQLKDTKELILDNKDSELFLESDSEEEASEIQDSGFSHPFYTSKKESLDFFENLIINYPEVSAVQTNSEINFLFSSFDANSFVDKDLLTLEFFFVCFFV